jgi:hypothetical protein
MSIPSERMMARTILAAFYGIDIRTHDDPIVAVSEGPIAELGKTTAGVPGLVVRLSLCLYLRRLLSVASLLLPTPCHLTC